jgi:hypothetical protein
MRGELARYCLESMNVQLTAGVTVLREYRGLEGGEAGVGDEGEGVGGVEGKRSLASRWGLKRILGKLRVFFVSSLPSHSLMNLFAHQKPNLNNPNLFDLHLSHAHLKNTAPRLLSCVVGKLKWSTSSKERT